jgi:type IV pilus assembly protein PilA
MQKKQKGFSLIELLIVIAIILVIAAIAIPNLMGSKISANEASAVASLRTVEQACVTYSDEYGTGYPAALSNLGPSPTPGAAAADLIDDSLATGTKSGYNFVYVPAAPDPDGLIDFYTLNANPASSATGTRYFYIDQSSLLTWNPSAPASNTDSPL